MNDIERARRRRFGMPSPEDSLARLQRRLTEVIQDEARKRAKRRQSWWVRFWKWVKR